MRDVLPTLEQWASEGRRFALATVVQTWGSSPRPIGSVMGVRDDGLICGSVSGGCVEGSVIAAALESLRYGEAREMDFSGLSEGSVWDVGLSCGGRIQVWVDPAPISRSVEVWSSLISHIHSDLPLVLVTCWDPFGQRVWEPSSSTQRHGDTEQDADDVLEIRIEAAYDQRQSEVVEVCGKRYFLQVLPCRERLVIVGAVHIAVPLVKFAKSLGFETVVVDPRGAFASSERFPDGPDQIVCEWPEEGLASVGLTEETYAVVLTHDPKIDDVALALLLKSPVAYIGALGSRTTQAQRRTQLLSTGFTEAEVDRIHGPVGLAIGARSPEEIALSIMAEIVQVRRARR